MVMAWQAAPKQQARFVEVDEAQIGEGDVVVDVSHSSLNYKDGLALTGSPGVVRREGLVPGIDLVGTVRSSDDARFAVGKRVLVNGFGIGERFDGGYSPVARVRGDWLVRVPDALGPDAEGAARAAAIGTAGFTAMLCVLAIEHGSGAEGAPDAREGDVLVTGAAGGVGSVAISLLSRLGYRVVASTGRVEEQGDALRALGAADVIDRAQFAEAGGPLESTRWAAVVDSVGGPTLARAIAQTRWGGVVAVCGMASGTELPATVLPFILRNVVLAGVNSVDCPTPHRQRAWDRLATDLDLGLLDSVTSTVALADVGEQAERILRGEVAGRTVVEIG